MCLIGLDISYFEEHYLHNNIKYKKSTSSVLNNGFNIGT